MIALHTYLRFLSRQAARRGLIRTLERFFERENMPAKDWPPEVRKEVLDNIQVELPNLEGVPPKQAEKIKKDVERGMDALRTTEGLKTLDLFKLKFKDKPQTLRLKTNLSDFTPRTKKRIERELDPQYQVQFRRHEERKQKQRELSEAGSNKKPVILVKYSNGLYVMEGVHRTLDQLEQAIENGKPTFELLAYVGKETPIRNMLKKLTNFLVNPSNKS